MVLISDPRVGVTAAHESAAAAMCVRLVDVSGILAIHIPTRSLLRSSSTHEPSDPPLRVVIFALRRTLPTLNRLPPPLPQETKSGRRSVMGLKKVLSQGLKVCHRLAAAVVMEIVSPKACRRMLCPTKLLGLVMVPQQMPDALPDTHYCSLHPSAVYLSSNKHTARPLQWRLPSTSLDEGRVGPGTICPFYDRDHHYRCCCCCWYY